MDLRAKKLIVHDSLIKKYFTPYKISRLIVQPNQVASNEQIRTTRWLVISKASRIKETITLYEQKNVNGLISFCNKNNKIEKKSLEYNFFNLKKSIERRILFWEIYEWL